MNLHIMSELFLYIVKDLLLHGLFTPLSICGTCLVKSKFWLNITLWLSVPAPEQLNMAGGNYLTMLSDFFINSWSCGPLSLLDFISQSMTLLLSEMAISHFLLSLQTFITSSCLILLADDFTSYYEQVEEMFLIFTPHNQPAYVHL